MILEATIQPNRRDSFCIELINTEAFERESE